MVDYNRAAATATRLIAQAGRRVDFVRHLASAPAPGRLMDGPENPAVETITAPAVAVAPSSLAALGMGAAAVDMFKIYDTTLIVAPYPGADLSQFHSVIDEGVTFKIERVDTLRPATVTLLYFVGISNTRATQ